MKLYLKFKKLPLVVLIFLGLACAPMLASAGGGDRHGQYKQGHGESSRSARQGNRHSYKKGYRDGYRDGDNRDRHSSYSEHHSNSYRRYGHGDNYGRNHGNYYNRVGIMVGLYSDNLDVIYSH